MGDREDRKLREVAVGRYGYRHEAEFAAGFLDDAGIPYRLQVDDPAMGMTLSASAIVWVHAMDAERARDVLETGGEAPGAPDGEEEEHEEAERNAEENERGAQRPPLPAPRDAPTRARPPLAARPRLLALAVGLALLSVAVLGVLPGILLSATSGVFGAGLSLVALLGRAPDAVHRALSTLSGDLT